MTLLILVIALASRMFEHTPSLNLHKRNSNYLRQKKILPKLYIYWPLNNELFHHESNQELQNSTAVQQFNQTALILKKNDSLDLVIWNYIMRIWIIYTVQSEQHQCHINFPCVSFQSNSMVNTCNTVHHTLPWIIFTPSHIEYW